METFRVDKDLFDKSPKEFITYIHRIYNVLDKLAEEYPNFNTWFYNQVLNDLIDGKRIIIIKEVSGEIAAISIMKITDKEKKISTFRVVTKYQSLGIGKSLMSESINLLEIEKPLITVSETRLSQFEKLFKLFKFELVTINNDYYKNGFAEYSFNGPIEQSGILAIDNSKLIAERITQLLLSSQSQKLTRIVSDLKR